jgi:hypothetical protein
VDITYSGRASNDGSEDGGERPASADGKLARRTAALRATIAGLQQRQQALIRELEQFAPSGNDDFDQQWRAGIQTRFVAILAEQRTKQELLAELHRQAQAQPSVDLSLLEAIPQENIDLARLPEDQQRRLYDAFHLELRYNDRTREFGLRVTITGETAAELGATVAGIAGQPAPSGSGRQRTAPDDLVAGALRARGGSRTAHQSATARGGAI